MKTNKMGKQADSIEPNRLDTMLSLTFLKNFN